MQFPARARKMFFLFQNTPIRTGKWRLLSLLFNENRGPGRGDDHSLPTNAMVENA